MNTFPEWRTVARAMRWARRHHGSSLTVQRRRYEDRRIRYSWVLYGTEVLSILTSPSVAGVHLYAGDSDYQVHVSTRDAQRVLDVLVALGLLFREYSSVFHCGRLAGQVDLAREMDDARKTYDIVEQAGREVGEQVMGR